MISVRFVQSFWSFWVFLPFIEVIKAEVLKYIVVGRWTIFLFYNRRNVGLLRMVEI